MGGLAVPLKHCPLMGGRALMSFRAFLSDQTAHSSEMEAWIAGACAVADYLVRPVVRPKEPAQVD